ALRSPHCPFPTLFRSSLAVIGMLVAETAPIVQGFLHRTIDPRSFEVVQGWEADPSVVINTADQISKRFMTVKASVSGETQDGQRSEEHTSELQSRGDL